MGFMSCVQIFPETRVDKIRLSRSIKERTYLEADLVGSDGGVAADGVGGGDGRRVDLGVGVVGRRRRVEAPAAVVHLEPIEHRRAVDQVAGDAAQPRHVLTQQPPQRHLAPNANVSFPIGRRNQRRSATSWHSIRPRIGRVSGSSDRFRVGGWVDGERPATNQGSALFESADQERKRPVPAEQRNPKGTGSYWGQIGAATGSGLVANMGITNQGL